MWTYHLLGYSSRGGQFMSQDDEKLHNPPPDASEQNTLTLAQNLIRKMDEDSRRKLDQVSAQDKTQEQGAA